RHDGIGFEPRRNGSGEQPGANAARLEPLDQDARDRQVGVDLEYPGTVPAGGSAQGSQLVGVLARVQVAHLDGYTRRAQYQVARSLQEGDLPARARAVRGRSQAQLQSNESR